jgi:hypothetical protein
MSDANDSLTAALQAGAAAVERCHDAPAEQAKKAFGDAMLRIIAARNDRIHALTQGADDEQLPRVNALLSVMSSIEFPLAGFHRERLGEVDSAMRALLRRA